MDPFSLIVGALALAQTGTTLTTFLFDIAKDIKSASATMAEVASDVQLTSTLLADLGNNLDANPHGYSENFLVSVKNLCDQCKGVFEEIEGTVGRKRGVEKVEWLEMVAWAFRGKKGVKERQGRLRELQFMFLFVSQIEMIGGGSKRPGGIKSGGQELTAGDLEGQLVEVPVQISGSNAGGREPARYTATLTLRAAPAEASNYRARTSAAQDSTARNRCLLINMRRSPRFSADLLEPLAPMERRQRKDHAGQALDMPMGILAKSRIFDDSYDDDAKIPRIPTQKEAENDIDDLLATWCGKRPVKPSAKGPPSPSTRPDSSSTKTPPSPRPSATNKPASPKLPPKTNQPTRSPSVRIHEVPGLPPITSYGSADYPLPSSSSSSSQRPPPPPPPPQGGSVSLRPQGQTGEPTGNTALRTSAAHAGPGTARTSRRPKSAELPREHVTRYYIDRR